MYIYKFGSIKCSDKHSALNGVKSLSRPWTYIPTDSVSISTGGDKGMASIMAHSMFSNAVELRYDARRSRRGKWSRSSVVFLWRDRFVSAVQTCVVSLPELFFGRSVISHFLKAHSYFQSEPVKDSTCSPSIFTAVRRSAPRGLKVATPPPQKSGKFKRCLNSQN